ncbi:transglycosylase domain-containing protein [Martelella mediterranea]|uniref:Penicillin-binding protein 1A n=1 Tax=Martelella mediterranea TaxID=293089 RepID=A0A4R3NWJ4_9HYPH|nr:transglycosylase domain-containing protein [Martelella mediterranea]TCT44969.1 penicillin-binding protein 1A [Martelella mediterranea]
MAGKKKNRSKTEPSLSGKTAASRKPAKKKSGKVSTASARRTSTRRPKRGVFGRSVRFVFYWGCVAAIWGGIVVAGIIIYYGAKLPPVDEWAIPDRAPNVKIVANDGSLIANRGANGGEALSINEMSPYIPMAVVAIEDRRFYSHFGVDPIGLARAMVTNIMHGDVVQGGSTLTQQLAKNVLLTHAQTLERKVQEALMALWLEHKYTKDQILAMYLNRVYFGSGAYGVEAASQRYFDKSARDVTLGEAALLAGLLKAPSRLSPARDPQAAESRAQVVLGAMHDQNMISDSDMATAMAREPKKAPSYWSGAEHYAADMVMQDLPDLVGKVETDIVVHTTLDPGLERDAETSLKNALDKNGKKDRVGQGALVALDATGAIRAIVGGRDYAKSQYNRAAVAKRQPGSAFKPFVYAKALEIGDHPSSVRNDAPIRIGDWTPENYEKTYAGPMLLTEALAESVNTIAAQLVMEASPEEVVKLAHKLGIESDITANASLALGTSEVTLLELTGAYTAFMNGGFKATPYLISSIETTKGKPLYKADYANPPRVLSPQVAANMNGMLMRVVTEGTGHNAQIPGWQVAGKTGTTQSSRDALFVGFTSNLTAGVWLGNDDNSPMRNVTGGRLPAEVWHDFMAEAHQGLKPKPLYGGGKLIEPAPARPNSSGDNGNGTTLVELLGRLNGNNKSGTNASTGNDGMPVPPGSVGEAQPAPEQQKRRGILQLFGGG